MANDRRNDFATNSLGIYLADSRAILSKFYDNFIDDWSVGEYHRLNFLQSDVATEDIIGTQTLITATNESLRSKTLLPLLLLAVPLSFVLPWWSVMLAAFMLSTFSVEKRSNFFTPLRDLTVLGGSHAFLLSSAMTLCLPKNSRPFKPWRSPYLLIIRYGNYWWARSWDKCNARKRTPCVYEELIPLQMPQRLEPKKNHRIHIR